MLDNKDELIKYNLIKYNFNFSEVSRSINVGRETVSNTFKKLVSNKQITEEELSKNIKYVSKTHLEYLYCNRNYNINQLMKHFNVSSRKSILEKLVLFNIINPLKNSITELYKLGFTKEEISKELNLSIEVIEYNFKHHSIWREKPILAGINLEEFIKLRLEDRKSVEELATYYSTSTRTIHEFIKRNELHLPTTQKFYFTKEELEDLYVKKNLTMDQIAEIYKCCRKTINDSINEFNICKDNALNSYEQLVNNYLKDLNINFIVNSRSIISPKELDFYLPEYNLGIEICGVYWHSTKINKNKFHIKEKLDLCEELGIRLITIFEDEILEKKEIVLNRLKHILNLDNVKLYARDCTVRQIESREGIDFLNKTHIQGSGKNSVYLGAFHDTDLVAVMSFSKPSVAKGSFKATWELNRFSTYFPITGIGSKLLKFFEINFEWDSIISYCDKRWNTGKVYKLLGFEQLKDSQPNYWYVVRQTRKHRWNYTKYKLLQQFPEKISMTEEQIMEEQGIYRIYDCGNMRFIKYNA